MIYLYILYVIFSGVILAVFNKKHPNEWLLKMIVVSFVPVIGWMLPIIWPETIIKNRGEELEKYMQQQDQDITFEQLDIHGKVEKEKELNVVAIEDALLVSENAERRQKMIDVLKEDTMNYLEVLQKAVQNEDTETSHYAVSAIMEVKRKLSISIQELAVKYEYDKQDDHLARTYAKVLKEYMRSGFLDELTLKKYKYTYINILGQIIKNDSDAEFAFEDKLKFEIQLEEFSEAEKTCLLYLEKYPAREESYLSLMEYYFTTKSITKLQQVMDSLKRSNVVLSNRALTIVRYWSEGADYERKNKLF